LNHNGNLLFLGAVNGLLAVAAGAFGAHGLKAQLSAERLATWETAAHYHLIHAVMMVVIAMAIGSMPVSRFSPRIGWLFLAGIILFSGSLYALALTGIRTLGIITPFGGVSFLSGWILLAICAFRMRSDDNPAVSG
jgi:uncharacterized membrane protein YgdD (TMEM256/DUF423 family)